MAGTQLHCALDPPRQALCLRMAYRIPYSNLLLIFLSFSYPSKPPFSQDILRIYIITSKEILRNPKEGALRTRHRGPVQRLLWILEPQDASKMPPRWAKRHQDTPKRPQEASKRPQDASKTAKEAPKTSPRGSKTPPRHVFGAFWEAIWGQVGTKIAS